MTELLNIESTESMQHIRVYNSVGVLIFYKNSSDMRLETIDLSDYNSGLYLIQINIHNQIRIGKFLKF